MKPRHIIQLVSAMIIISACSETKKQNEETNTHKEQSIKHNTSDDKHHSKTANEHMHRSSVEELIKRFESPERDAYQHPEKVLAYLGDISNKKIIDIGAGSGYFSVKLANKGAKVIAADVSDEFLAALEERIEDNKLKNIELRKIPYDSPGLSKKEVDMVFIVNTYHHIEERVDYFSQVKKGINDTGELIIIDFYKKELPVGPKPDHKISKANVIAELKKAGFSIVDINEDLLPYQYIIRAK